MAYNITALIPKGRNARLAGGLLILKKGTIFYRKKMSQETILTIVYLFLMGYSISNMPPLVHVTERSIRNLLEDVTTRFKKYEALIVAPSGYIPNILSYPAMFLIPIGVLIVNTKWVRIKLV